MRIGSGWFAAGACCALAIGCGSSSKSNGADATPPTPDAGPPVALTGHVYDNGGGTAPLAGATVSIAGATPAITTTSGADGSYTLTVGSNQTLFVRAAKSSYLAEQIGVVVGPSGASVDLAPIPMSEVTAAEAAIAGLTFDQSKGEVEVVLTTTVAEAEDFTPMISADHDPQFGCDAGGCKEQQTITDLGALIFPNTVVGDTSVSVTPPASHACTVDIPGISAYRVDAYVLTAVQFECT